ncbi:MEDS domain-containing protein [Mesobacillus subterraneus]|uniref:3-ketoacyl-ACP reductase n=1 Tax=Mesobacillus subterraneus TaxID=285983 RepID=A0A3R9EXP4_9BACI|nr:MEDS domain-containing protein [Mesobacillus subterraneus]RSD25474.1 3-ketoacyl-ACP reductase [Mesobacillus subterraneus]
MHTKIKNLLVNVKDTGAHIFYPFENEERYIDNVLEYIRTALEHNNHVMVIENDRIMPEIKKRIEAEFDKEQIEMIHIINNYDFYCYRGNFHKETILSYLQKVIAPFIENNIPVLTWAHVEWRDQDEIFQTLSEYEKEADEILQATNLITICGYDSNRVPESLKETLLECHDYYMTDDTINKIDRTSRIN